jgi:hypothetical protein
MVNGCRVLAENNPLYFVTITCRGREITHEYAEKHYGEWTNRLLDACRAKWKRAGGEWHYVQVTERQKRLHPHSHFITTFAPPVSTLTTVRKKKRQESGQYQNIVSTHIRSNWFEGQIKKAGLGDQYDISVVQSSEGASRYVAKYLFKPSIFETNWPKGWKRIRYSQGFPKQEDKETGAIVLLTREDWVTLSELAIVVNCPDLDVYETVTTKMTGSDVIVRLKMPTVK